MLTGELIGLKSVILEAESGTLIENADFSFNETSRIAIVGANGAGKSTLLRAMAGIVEPFGGRVVTQKGALIEYVPQFVPDDLKELSVIDSMTRHIETRRPILDVWKAYDILTRFGFADSIFQRPVGQLSGGEANRVLLARALVVEPDFILLDEPTNHLDIAATVRFEQLICEEMNVPFCIVSHDRELLDRCTSQTLFIRDRQLYFFGLPYTDAREALFSFDEEQRQRLVSEQKEIQRLKESADKKQNWVKMNSKFASRYQNIRRRVETLRQNQTVLTNEKKKELALSPSELKVKSSLRIDSCSVTRPNGSELFTVKNLSVLTGDRIAIMGANGAGKSSLLRMLVESFKASSPNVKFNPQVHLGYFDQELAELPLEKSVFEYLSRAVSQSDETVRKGLIASGIPYNRHGDLLSKFSGGERARVLFLALKFTSPNFLVLDEPTNHIDVQGIEDLEEELLESGTTIVMVSHDRRFVEQVATRFFVVHDRELQEVGDATEYYSTLAVSQIGEADATADDEEMSLIAKMIALEDELTSNQFTENEVSVIRQKLEQLSGQFRK